MGFFQSENLARDNDLLNMNLSENAQVIEIHFIPGASTSSGMEIML